MRSFAVVAALALAGSALAQTLAIDTGGGPLTLPEEVAVAVAAWSDASEQPLGLEVSDAGEVLLGFGDPALLGPDTLALTLQTSSAEGTEVEVRLNPTSYRTVPGVIEHELGILLGLAPSTGEAILNPAKGPAAAAAPTAADRAALTLLQTTAPEDVNRDGLVDFYDLAALAAAFGNQGINLAADLNRDGVVDDGDIELLRAAYVFTPPSRSAPEVRPPQFAAPPAEAPPPDGDLPAAEPGDEVETEP